MVKKPCDVRFLPVEGFALPGVEKRDGAELVTGELRDSREK